MKFSSIIFLSFFLLPSFYYMSADHIESFQVNGIHVAVGLFLLVLALFEEVVFRFLLPKIFGESLKLVLLSSILFATCHLFNDGSSITSFIVTFVASLILFWIRFNIGFSFSVIAHFFWNFQIAVLFGQKVSGFDLLGKVGVEPILKTDKVHQSAYGIEGEFSTLIISVVLFVLLSLRVAYVQKFRVQQHA